MEDIEHEPTLEEKTDNKDLALDAVTGIRDLVKGLNIKLGTLIEELEEETKQGVFDGDWISELEEFEGNLISKINTQFNI